MDFTIFAQITGQSRAIHTALSYLRICPDARGGGMGEVGIALANNANGLHWNPSVLPFAEKRFGLALNYTSWLPQLYNNQGHNLYFPAYINIGEKVGVIGASFRYFSWQEVPYTDASGNFIRNFTPIDYDISLAYSRKITKELSCGISGRYIHSRWMPESYGGIKISPIRTFAGDLHLFYLKNLLERDESALDLKIGGNISNIGPKVSYIVFNRKSFIPINLGIGTGLTFRIKKHAFTFGCDLNKLLVPSDGLRSQKSVIAGMFSSFGDAPGGFKEELSEITVSNGLQYSFNNTLFIRTGYFYEAADKGGRNFFTIGLGMKIKFISGDFAYILPTQSNQPLTDTFRVGLSFDFWDKKE